MHSVENINPGGEIAKGMRSSHQTPNVDALPITAVHQVTGSVHCKSEIDTSLPLLLPISPLQPYHNNGKFREILEDVVARNLSVIIVISDLPKKFTFMMEGEDESSSEKKAIALGLAWIKKNLTGTNNNDLYMQLNEQNKIKIYCWRDFIMKYQIVLNVIRKEIINKIYENKDSNLYKSVSNAVDGYVTSFVTRNLNNPLVQPEDDLKVLSTEHVLEEVAMIFLWKLLGYKQMAYPNSQVQHKLNERLFNCINAVVTDLRHDKKLLTVFELDCFKQEPMSLDNEMKLFDTKELKSEEKRVDSPAKKGINNTAQSSGVANSSDTKQSSPGRQSNSIKAGVNHTLFASNSSDLAVNGTSALSAVPVEPSTTPPDPLEILFRTVVTSPLTQQQKIEFSVGIVNSLRNGQKASSNEALNSVAENTPTNRPM